MPRPFDGEKTPGAAYRPARYCSLSRAGQLLRHGVDGIRDLDLGGIQCRDVDVIEGAGIIGEMVPAGSPDRGAVQGANAEAK